MKRILFGSFLAFGLLLTAVGAAIPRAEAALDFSNTADLSGSTPYVLQSSANATESSLNTPSYVVKSSANKGSDLTTSNEITPVVENPFSDKYIGQGIQYIMSLFAWLVGVAAITLDNAVYYTVVTMGDYVNHLAAVGTAWHILRDIGNMVLIFGFLAIGITVILNVDWYGGGYKMLPTLLIAAVFLNFSLFISEAIIDVGNLFATQVFTQINGAAPPQPVSFSLNSIHSEGISNKIMSQLGLQGIYQSAFTTDGITLGGNSSFLIGFMGIILFMIAAFVMFSLAFILIARFVALIFLIIVAPVGFAGLAVPKLSSYADKWWDTLVEQVITAPVLLLMLYVALAVITDANFLSGLGSVTDATAYTGFVQNTNLPGFAAIILSYLIAMGLLLAVTVFAKRMSAFGASGAMKLAGKASFGVGAWGLNRTAGRGAYYLGRGLRQNRYFNKFDAVTGRVVTKALDRTAKSTFDVRATGLLNKLPSGGVDAGEAQKDGFVGARERTIKEHEEAVKKIEEAHKDAFRELSRELRKITDTAETYSDKKKAAEEAQTKKAGAERVALEAQNELKLRDAEVERVRALDEENKRLGVVDPNTANALKAALQEQQQSVNTLKTATDSLDKAKKTLEEAENNEKEAKNVSEEAKKAPKERLKKDIEKNKNAYVDSLGNAWNPVNWVANGPGSNRAARKIKESFKEKSKDQKALDAMKAYVEEEAKKNKTKAEESGAGEGRAEPAH